MPATTTFRFDAIEHCYIDLETGEALPHITGMLEQAGWVDDTWMTEESSQRGTAVHALTRDYDLKALDVATCRSPYRPYLLAHVAASRSLRPAWDAIEEPAVHPVYLFGGRPDRVGRVQKLHTVLEVKTAVSAKAHQIQTALQAILVAAAHPLPAEAFVRYALYLKPSGRFKLEHHTRRADLDEAYRVIRTCCR